MDPEPSRASCAPEREAQVTVWVLCVEARVCRLARLKDLPTRLLEIIIIALWCWVANLDLWQINVMYQWRVFRTDKWQITMYGGHKLM